MGYRDDWFKNNNSGLNGKYKCVECKKSFTKSAITIDHRIPLRKGGTDHLWNLQPMCRSCNSSKRERQTAGETLHSILGATLAGDLHKLIGSVAKRKVKDALGIKYKR